MIRCGFCGSSLIERDADDNTLRCFACCRSLEPSRAPAMLTPEQQERLRAEERKERRAWLGRKWGSG